MDIITQLIHENGILAIVGTFISFVLASRFTLSKIHKVSAERNKLLAQTKEINEKITREREMWEEENTVTLTACTKIVPAKKTGGSMDEQFERLNKGSFFKAEVSVTNLGNKPITIDEVRFVGQEQFVENGYAGTKLKTIDKQMKPEGKQTIEPGGTEKFCLNYTIGTDFNERMGVDICVKARVGIKPTIEKTFSERLVYLY